MLTIGEERYIARAVHALERIAKQLENANKILESACADFDITEKTEDKE